MAKLVALNTVDVRGEIMKEVFFINIAGGDKTFLVFESGRILVIPVYRECPVQYGSMADIRADLEMFLQILAQDKIRIQSELGETAAKIEELIKWAG